MDLDAGADDFFAALNSGDADGFMDFNIADMPAPDVTVATVVKTEGGRAATTDEQVH